MLVFHKLRFPKFLLL